MELLRFFVNVSNHGIFTSQKNFIGHRKSVLSKNTYSMQSYTINNNVYLLTIILLMSKYSFKNVILQQLNLKVFLSAVCL